jgi:NhaP-type Na+/H+ or K+/H+ antiporter
MHTALIALSILFFTGHFLGWFFEKTKIPDLLILVFIGYLLGPVFGFFSEEDFGKAGSLLSSMALVVILYQGGLHLSFQELKEGFLKSFILSLLTFLSIAFLGFLVAFTLGGQSFGLSLLLGFGIGSTSSAVVIPMVKPLSLSNKAKTILSLESAFTDVLTIVIFLVVLNGLEAGSFSTQSLLIGLGPKTLLSIVFGFFGALLWATFKKHFSQIFKMPFAGEAWAILVYGVIEAFSYNGAIGVLVLGFFLANLQLLPNWVKSQTSTTPVSYRDMAFLNTLSFMLKTVFFIYLGVLVKFSDPVLVAIAVLLTALIFITRYFCIRLLFNKNSWSQLDVMVTTAMGPRGLACAVLATLPVQKGIEGGEWLQSVIFSLIPLSIFFTAIFVSVFEVKTLRDKCSSMWEGYLNDTTSSESEETA